LLALLLASVHSVFAEPRDNQADDPLPEGAKVRFGITRPILRTGPSVGLVPPSYTNFLAPTMAGGIRRYDLGTGRPLDKMGIVGPGQVVVSADGKRAAVARPGVLQVVEVASGKSLLAVAPPEGVIIVGTPGVSLSADGKALAYGGRGKDAKGAVVVWDVDRNESLAEIETIVPAPVFPLLSRDGKTLVTHGPPPPPIILGAAKQPPMPMPAEKPDPDMARVAQVWQVSSGKELCKVQVTGMGGRIVGSALSPDGQIVAIAAGDGPVDLWETKTGKRLQTLLGRKGQGVRVAISPDGKKVASVGPDYRIHRWQTDGKLLDITEPPPGILIAPITGLTFADNDRAIAWLTAGHFVVAWEAPSGKRLSPEMDHCAAINSIAFPPEEKNPFTSGIDGRVFRWDLKTGALSETVTLHPLRIPGEPLIGPVVTLSKDGKHALWARTPAQMFDIDSGHSLYVVPAPSTPPAAVHYQLSPDGTKVITLSRQAEGRRFGYCVIWDIATRQRVAEFDIPATNSASAPIPALGPDGTRLAIVTLTRNAAGNLVLMVTGFDVKTGKKVGEVENPAGTAGTLWIAAANDTSAVLASSAGRVWSVDFVAGKVGEDIDNVQVRGELPLTGGVVFSPDGKRFAIGVVGEPYTTYGVRVYDWPQRKPLQTFIGHAGPVTALRFTNDGKSLASGAQDTSVLVWDLSKLPDAK
jgi:WD40 repeat protein